MLSTISLASLANVDKTKLLNTFVTWAMFGLLLYFLVFKEDDSKLNNATMKELVTAVQDFNSTSKQIAKTAAEQREWAASIERQLAVNNQLLKRGYKDIYETYGYTESDSNSPLDDLYASQLQQPTVNEPGGDLRRNEDGVSKTPTLQRTAATH